MGRAAAPRIAARFGRAILELGGNNGMIVAPSADLDLAAARSCSPQPGPRPALHHASPVIRA